MLSTSLHLDVPKVECDRKAMLGSSSTNSLNVSEIYADFTGSNEVLFTIL